MPDPETPRPPRPARPVRSFVRRQGRLTTGQRRALDELWPRWGVEPGDALFDFATLFGRDAPVVLEIGFGNGETLVAMARAAPEQNFLGIEVHEPGVGHCLLALRDAELDNVRLVARDALEVLRDNIPAASLGRVNLFFPDPWPKKRHHKRRIVQPGFVARLESKLQPGGIFHVVTDWPDYAEHIDAIMAAADSFEALPAAPADRPVSRFDARGRRLGHRNKERAWRLRHPDAPP